MTWSYDSTSPNSSAMSKVRLLIGDTSSGTALFEDEEILAFIASEGNAYSAAALACDALASKYAQRADQRVGALSVSLGKISDNYRKQAERYRKRAKRGGQIYAGGVSYADVETQEADTDQVLGDFDVGMTDFPGYVGPDGANSTDPR